MMIRLRLVTLLLLSTVSLAAPLKADWIKIETIPATYKNNYWLEVYFLPDDPNYGWVCGFNGNVIRTTDGGITWRGTTVLNSTSNDFEKQLESIHFVSKDVGYTSGPYGVYRSTDGGATWRIISRDITPSIWGVCFVDENTGMAVGGGCVGSQYFCRTTNAGSTWTVIPYSYPASGMTDISLYSANGLGYAVSSGLIWKTTNGGYNWTVISQSGDNDWQEDIHVVGNSILVPYSGDCGGDEITKSGIRMTTNGGASWRQYRTGTSMFGSYLLDEKHGWACGYDASVYYTSDGGVTWHLDNCGVDKGMDMDDIWFVNDTTGWLVGDHGVYKYHNYEPLEPEIQAMGPTKLCAGQEVTLTTTAEFPDYLWSTGETTRSITVSKAGTYSVTASSNECDSGSSNTIDVVIVPAPKPAVAAIGPDSLCEGTPLVLYIKGEYSSYLWSTGETTDSITVTSAGTYAVSIIDSNGCEGKASKTVYMRANPKPEINVKGDTVFCKSDPSILYTASGYENYRWFTLPSDSLVAEGNNELVIYKTGTYYVEVTDKYGCKGVSPTRSFTVKVDSNRYIVSVNHMPDTLEFDSVNLTYRKCLPFTIRNVSSEEMVIDDIFVYRNIEFSLKQSVFPLTVPPYGTVSVDVCYYPSAADPDIDSAILGDNCSPHIIYFSGKGSPNYYNGDTRCHTPIMIVTTKLNRPLFQANPVYPNPVQGIATSEIGMFTPTGSVRKAEAVVCDLLGNTRLVPDIAFSTVTETENGTLSMGTIIIDGTKLTSGSYYLKVTDGNEVLTFVFIKY